MQRAPADALASATALRTDPVDFVSVVLPAADEAENLPAVVAGIRTALAGRARRFELIVVVPSPEDPTVAAARAAGARVVVQKRPGYGGALREGLRAAAGDFVVSMDADGSHPPEAIPALLEHRNAAEVVICSRYVESGSAEMSAFRWLLSRLLNGVFSRLLAVPVRDMSSGFRIYRRRVLRELDLAGERYDVLEEILVQLYSLGYQVAEIPFDYLPRRSGATHARPLAFTPHFASTFWRLFKLRNHHQSADYDSRAYDSLVLPQRYWQRRRFRIVTEWLAAAGHPRLDVGCGSSRIIQSEPRAVGLDFELPKLRFLRRSHRRLVQGDTASLPFASGAFAAAVHSQVLEHVPYDRRIFRELNRVLRPGGLLVIGTPDYGRVQWRVIERLYKLLLPNAYGDDHITHYTRHTLTEELAEAGFGIVRYAYILGGELIMQCVKREELPPEAGHAGAPRP
jgi:glycosyltransferase involved in cell wall biosynthesis